MQALQLAGERDQWRWRGPGLPQPATSTPSLKQDLQRGCRQDTVIFIRNIRVWFSSLIQTQSPLEFPK